MKSHSHLHPTTVAGNFIILLALTCVAILLCVWDPSLLLNWVSLLREEELENQQIFMLEILVLCYVACKAFKLWIKSERIVSFDNAVKSHSEKSHTLMRNLLISQWYYFSFVPQNGYCNVTKDWTSNFFTGSLLKYTSFSKIQPSSK